MNGDGAQYYYANGESARVYDVDGGATLYAKWTADTYDVVLNAQGGSGGLTVTAVYDGNMPIIAHRINRDICSAAILMRKTETEPNITMQTVHRQEHMIRLSRVHYMPFGRLLHIIFGYTAEENMSAL